MPSDPDSFLLRAIRARRRGDTGEDVLPEQADEFAQLERIGAALAEGEPVELVEPPAELWAQIEAATAQTEPPGSSGASAPTDSTPLATGRQRTGRATSRRRRLVWLGVAAAALLVAVTAALLSREGDKGDVVANAELEQLVETGTAQATLVRVDGEYRLDLEIEGVEAADGFLELWLIGPGDVSGELRLISLGVVNESGSYPVPAGIELSAFPIVDISVEPFDGNPSHSGDSLLRGELDV
jgi:hypothetical protein